MFFIKVTKLHHAISHITYIKYVILLKHVFFPSEKFCLLTLT